MAEAVRVHGLASMNRALRRTSKEVRVGIRAELRGVAEPVRAEAEQLAAARIRNMTVPWSRMRIGITTDLVYVAPRKRGIKGRSPRRRGQGTGPPSFADLLMDRSMAPALAHHADDAEREVDEMLGRVCNHFSRG